jgi:death on curing protein
LTKGAPSGRPFRWYRFTASEADAAQAVLELAAGTIDQEGYRHFLRANAERT